MVVAFDIDVIVWNLSIYWWLLVLKCVSSYSTMFFETVTMQTICCLQQTRSLLNLQILVLQEKKLWLNDDRRNRNLALDGPKGMLYIPWAWCYCFNYYYKLCTSDSNKAGTFWCLLTENDDLLHWHIDMIKDEWETEHNTKGQQWYTLCLDVLVLLEWWTK